jgi:diacylglycerol kinase (ATP)
LADIQRKTHIIYNPGAKSGANDDLLSTILIQLKEGRCNCSYTITRNLEDAHLASIIANREGFETIIAVGGDGTINRVINGFYDENGKRASQAKLGVIHTGTSPDFCKSYAIPTKVRAAIDCILKAKTTSIQVGKISLAKTFHPEYHTQTVTSNSDFITRYFACCANIGLGASLARYANQGIRKYMGDFLGTFVSLIRVLIEYKPASFTIVLDDRQTSIENIFNIAIGRTGYIASGIKIKNDLKENDDRFYTLVVKNLRLSKIPLCLRKIYSGKTIQNSDYFDLDYHKKIEIFGNKYNPEVEFDGDPAGFLPCKIEMAPDPLEVYIPGDRNAKESGSCDQVAGRHLVTKESKDNEQ